jgi:HK97 gp10 family phage protein
MSRVYYKKRADYNGAVHGMLPEFLQAAGLIVEGQAKELCPVDSGRLRNSINSEVKDDSAFVGTNVHYAPHVEYGTRRPTPAQPYLRPSIDKKKTQVLKLFRDMFEEAF